MDSVRQRQLAIVMGSVGAVLLVLGVVLVVTDDDDELTSFLDRVPQEEPESAEPTATPEPTATAEPSVTSEPPATPTAAPTEAPTPDPTATPVPEPTEIPAEDPEDFLALLVEGLRGDAELLVSRLNQATLDRYGEAQCSEALPTLLDPTAELTLREFGEIGPWDYTTDELVTSIPDALPVEVSRIAAGQTLIQELHWQLVDGLWTWFSDCGEPLNPA